MTEAMEPAQVLGGAPPRGVFRRRAHLWQVPETQQSGKHAAPLPPQGTGRGRPVAQWTQPRVLQHSAKVRAAAVQNLLQMLPPEEGPTNKLVRLKGLPERERPEQVGEPCGVLEEEEEIDQVRSVPPPVRLYVGMYSGLYEGLECDGAPQPLPQLFSAVFPAGLRAHNIYAAERAARRRGPLPPCGWVTSGELRSLPAKEAAALAAPLSEHFAARFPSGTTAGALFTEQTQLRRAQRWSCPLPLAAAAWVVPQADAQGKAERAAAAQAPAAHFAARFPSGLAGTRDYEAARAQRHVARAERRGEAPGLARGYRQMEDMLAEGSLSAYFDSLLQKLQPAPKVHCCHSASFMMCACSAFAAVSAPAPKLLGWRCDDGCGGSPAACFAARFPKGTASQQERRRRVGAARTLQGLYRMLAAKKELSRLRALDDYFRQELEDA